MRLKRFAILALAVLLGACGGPVARKTAYMTKGREYLASHDFAKARLEFRNAVQMDPNDAEASFLAGQADERLGNMLEAAQMFQAAIEANGGHVGARAQLALIYGYSGAPDKALELVEPMFSIAPDDPDLLTARGVARQRRGELAAARADGERAVRIAPTNENAVTLLSSLYEQTGEINDAIEVVRAAVNAPTASAELRLVLARLYLDAKRRDDAIEQLRRAIAAEPWKLSYRYRLVEVLLLENHVDAAEPALRAAVAQAPDTAQPKLALVELLATHRSYEAAETELRRMTAAARADYPLRLGAGQFYARHGQAPAAETVYRGIIQDDGTGAVGLAARDLLASLYLTVNRSEAAAPLLEEVLRMNPGDDAALFARATLSLSRGNVDAAITDLRAVQHDKPKLMQVQRALASAYLAAGDPTLAEDTLRVAMQGDPTDVDVRRDLAQLLVRTGRVDRALPMLEKLATEQPASLTQALVDAQLAQGDFTAARRSVQRVQETKPELPAGAYLSGLVDLAEGRRDAARADFERALAMAPTAVDPATALVHLEVEDQHPYAATARLERLLGQHPDDPLLLNFKGQVLATISRTDAAIASFREAILRSPEWSLPYHYMAATQLAAGRREDALNTLQHGIEASHYAPMLVGDLAGLHERSGHPDAAIGLYESLLKHDPDSAVAANNLAMLLVTYRNDAATLERAWTLARRFAASQIAEFIDTWGWVLYKRGEYAEATRTLQKAVDRLPKAPELRYHLAMAQLKVGALDAARTSLEQALNSEITFPESGEAERALRELAE
jgi:tetratricopeptide (TPR) repeat protein